MKITTDSGEFIYQAYGDCCSESWFYGINGVLALLGFVVYTIEEVALGEVMNYVGRQEYTQSYCVKLTSTGGHTDIEFRNSSNGYYGGNIEYLGDTNSILNDKNKRTLEFRREYRKINWKEITDDYTA